LRALPSRRPAVKRRGHDGLPVVILCGGKGTRLREVISDKPKPMAPVGGRPFLEWLVIALCARGFRRLTIATGWHGEVIASHFGDGATWGAEISYSNETTQLGTAGALRLATEGTDYGRVAVLNGDSYCRFDLDLMERLHAKCRALASIWLLPVADASAFGAVELERSHEITRFREKSPGIGAGLVNAGVYVLEREVIDMIPKGGPASLEHDVFPRLIGQGLLGVPGPNGPFVDIGTPESYGSARDILKEDLLVLETVSAIMDPEAATRQHILRSEESLRATRDQCVESIVEAARIVTKSLREGHKVLLCGNGGSAADCQHMAAEFMSCLYKGTSRPGLAAIALTTDTSFLTAFSNDFGFEGIFERQVRALGARGDVLIAISTSGSSHNVRNAITAANELGIRTVGLTGAAGSSLAASTDCAIAVPSQDTQHIQENLLVVEHAICALVEHALFGN